MGSIKYSGGSTFGSLPETKKKQTQQTVFRQQKAAQDEKAYQQAKNTTGVTKQAYNKINSNKKSAAKSNKKSSAKTSSKTAQSSSSKTAQSSVSKSNKVRNAVVEALSTPKKFDTNTGAMRLTATKATSPKPAARVSLTTFRDKGKEIAENNYKKVNRVTGISKKAYDTAKEREKERENAQKAKDKKDTKWSNVIFQNASAGAAQFNKSLLGLADMAVNGAANLYELTGSPILKEMGRKIPEEYHPDTVAHNLINKGYESQNEIISRANEVNTKSNPNNKFTTPKQAAGMFTQNLVTMIPNMAAAVASGGASTGASLSSAGEGLAASAQNFIAAAAKNPAFWGSFSQTAGSSYADAKENGESDATATAYALINGALSAGVEITGGAETMPSFDKANKYLLQILKTSIEEGNEEAVQNAIETVTQQVLYKKKPNYTAEEFLKESAESWGMGAAMSGVMGAARYGGAKIANTAANTAETYRIGKEINQDTDLIKANIEEGLKQGKATDAYKTAKKNESFLADTSKKPSNMTSGKQFKANIQAEADLNAQKGLYKRQTGFDVLNKPSQGSFEGYTDSEKNSIVINDNYNHQADILAHEGGHAVESAAPEAASTAVSRTIEILNKPKYKAQFETRKNALRRAYAESGIKVSEAEIERDVAVDMRREGLLYKSAKEQAANISGKSHFGTDAAKRAEAAIKTAFGRTHTNENADITISALDADRIRRAWAKADADAAKATDGDVNEYNRNDSESFGKNRNEAVVANALSRFSIDPTENISAPETVKAFADNVDKVFKGELSNIESITIGDTPKLLQKYGAKALPIRINQTTMYKIAYPTGYFGSQAKGHNLGIPALKQLPYQIGDPMAILRSKTQRNSLVLLTEWDDTNGDPVIIPIHLNKNGTLGVENSVASAYGKENINSLLTDKNNKSTVLYTKDNKGINQILLNRLQLPDSTSDDPFVDDIISQPTANVKRKFEPNSRKLEPNNRRFSLDTDVEETRDLIAVHNLDESKIQSAFELGGFPMPSIAVTKAAQGHNGFGDISLVFDKNTIDPQRNSYNKVYGADAYTPTFPRTVNKVNSSNLASLAKKLGISRSMLEANVFEDADINTAERKLEGRNETRAAFVKDKGLKVVPEPVLRPARMQSGIVFNSKKAKTYFQSHNVAFDALVNDTTAREDYFSLFTNSNPLIRRKVDAASEILDAAKENPELYTALETKFEKDVHNLVTGSTQIDGYSYADGLNKLINEHKTEYEAYVKELVKPVMGEKYIRNNKDLFTPSGNRRSFDSLHDGYTLQNIVKHMREGLQTGGNGFIAGAPQVRAASARRFGSIDEIRANKDSIQNLSADETNAIKNDFADRLSGIIRQAVGRAPNLSQLEDFSDIIVEGANKYKTARGFKRYLQSYGDIYKVNDSLAGNIINLMQDMKAAPTRYFEAKPQRAVGFDEVKAAIVPSNVNPAIRQRLESAGIEVKEYPAGDTAARTQALNSLNKLKFSVDTKTPTSRLNEIADPNDGTGGKLSNLFKNTMHKEHYPEEFHAAADAREDKFRYKARSNKADYEAAQARIEQNGAEAVLNSLYKAQTWTARETTEALALAEHFNRVRNFDKASVLVLTHSAAVLFPDDFKQLFLVVGLISRHNFHLLCYSIQ